MTNVVAFPILVNVVDINFVTSKVPQIATKGTEESFDVIRRFISNVDQCNIRYFGVTILHPRKTCSEQTLQVLFLQLLFS